MYTYLDKRNFSLNEKRAKEISHQIATAVFYLQEFGIAHRDLKPENMLMSDDTEAAEIKLCDFGLSKFIGPTQTSTDPFGTISYVAPEVLLAKPHGKQVDIWSLGVITYLLLCGYLPFDDDDDNEIRRQSVHDAPDFDDPAWKGLSDSSKHIIVKMLAKEPKKRLTIQ